MIKIGEVYDTKNNGQLKVIDYENAASITVEFIATGYVTKAQQGDIRRGNVKDYLIPTVYGVGFMGGKNFSFKKDTKCYRTWHNMLRRCYAPAEQDKKYYEGCSVVKDWHNFQVFAEWFYKNYEETKKNCHLDKDIKVKGNKVYGPSTCTLVDPACNSMEARGTLEENYKLIDKSGKMHTFDNQRQFCVEHGLHTGALSNVLSGKRKSHKGFKKYDINNS